MCESRPLEDHGGASLCALTAAGMQGRDAAAAAAATLPAVSARPGAQSALL